MKLTFTDEAKQSRDQLHLLVEASGDFVPAELQSRNQMYFRLYRLRGDLLRLEINQLLQGMVGI